MTQKTVIPRSNHPWRWIGTEILHTLILVSGPNSTVSLAPCIRACAVPPSSAPRAAARSLTLSATCARVPGIALGCPHSQHPLLCDHRRTHIKNPPALNLEVPSPYPGCVTSPIDILVICNRVRGLRVVNCDSSINTLNIRVIINVESFKLHRLAAHSPCQRPPPTTSTKYWVWRTNILSGPMLSGAPDNT